MKQAVYIILVILIIWVSLGLAVEIDNLSNEAESLYTESVDEARRFSRQCNGRVNSVLSVKEYTFGAWALTCEWNEE